LIFTSLNGQTYQRLESLGDASYKRWSNTKWTGETYESLWKSKESSKLALTDDGSTGLSGLGLELRNTDLVQALEEVNPDHVGQSSLIAQNSVVYLTADTEDELTELKPGETYIIGGICDHNRYKVRAISSRMVRFSLIDYRS
jgi:tRNA (guanine9-N1)-methyltransferase